ncbi:putative reverse transcriptase domain-containing protein [Tanacetum coccineum]
MWTLVRLKLLRIGKPLELRLRSVRLSIGIELFSDYDCEIRYHPGKANVVDDALSRKERVNPKRVRAMNMILQSSIKDRILTAQKEVMDESGEVRTLIMDEAHKSKYFVHPGADKVYYDLRDMYWWPRIKKGIAEYDYKMERLARLYLNEIVARHGVPISIISDHDSRFTSRFWQSMQEALGTRLDMNFRGSWDVHLPLVEFSYNNSYHSSVRCAPFEALYGRKCRSPIMWVEVGEGQLIGPELVQETTEKISFVGPFKIIEKVGHVAYQLDLLEELNGVHDMFHVSNLKKCLADLTLKVPLDEI